MMEMTEQQNAIHSALKELIDQKSKRDHSHFSLSQLARAINMPHSILSKLTHEDPARRVSNPRIDTLSKIVDFFKRDGFDVTIDALMGKEQLKPIQEQPRRKIWIPLYFLDSDLSHKFGSFEYEGPGELENLMALVTDDYIEPMFKKGSVFVVDTSIKPVEGTLVAVRLPGHDQLLLRKLFMSKGKIALKLHDNDDAPLVLMPTQQHQIIGAVIQVIAKT
jgi:transcriptional regulator with XRE-family HTH domain